MHSLQKQFQKFVESHQLIATGDRTLVAVSGGVDSMVLVNLLKSLNYRFAIAHCNFQLRGIESDDDEQFVRDWAKENEIECHVKKVDVEGSIQLAARELRYNWFDELMKENGYTLLATAHHLDDSLETVLLNLVRGTGIKGLTGIAPRKDHLIRPLQFAAKKDLKEFAKNNGVSWREDRSNTSDDYDRNFIRNQVVPKLEELNPSLNKTFELTRERLQLTEALIEKKVEKVCEEYLVWNQGVGMLRLDWLQDESDLILLNHLLSAYGFNYVTIKEIFEARAQSGKEFSSNNYCVTTDREQLIITETGDLAKLAFELPGPGSYSFSNLHFDVEEVLFEQFSDDPLVAYFHQDQLKFPLKVRNWNQGDVFKPLGLGGAKKVSDLLIDRKVPVPLKKKVMVLESDETIAWVIGKQQADDFKLAQGDKRAIRITVRQ